MAITVTVKLDGAENLDARLRTMRGEVLAGASSVHNSLAEALMAQQRSNVPRDSGGLASSIHAEHPDRVTVEVHYGSDHYTGHVEYGTRYMSAVPVVRPAAAVIGARLESTMAAEASRRLNR